MTAITLDNVYEFSIPHSAYMTAYKAIDQGLRRIKHKQSMIITLLEESRSGKTHILKQIQKIYPPSRTEEGLNSPIVYFLTPSNPTEKSIAFNLLHEMGDPFCLKTSKSDYFMTNRVIDLLKKCGVKAIFIDEIQHFIKLWGKAETQKAANTLKNIAQQAGILLVVTGTRDAIGLFANDPQLERRTVQHLSLPRYDWESPPSRLEFCGILKGFYTRMVNCSMPEIYKGALAGAFWKTSLGLTGLLADFLDKTLWNVHDRLNTLERDLSLTNNPDKIRVIEDEINERSTINESNNRILIITLLDFEFTFAEIRGLEHKKIENPFTEILGTRTGLKNQTEPDFQFMTERAPRRLKKKESEILL